MRIRYNAAGIEARSFAANSPEDESAPMSPPVETVRSDERLPAAADAVVIGGGIVGMAAAYALARKGHSVAVVEKGRVAGEQSSRNWGWCRQQNRDEREIPLVQRSLAMWGELAGEVGADLGFRRSGLIYVTDRPSDLAEWERWSEMARGYQVRSEVLTAERARALTPGTAGRWIGGVYAPTDGRAEPSRAGPALAEAARRLGATVHQDCAARGLERTGGRVSAVVTERGTIRANAVLLAGGAWASMFCRRHGVSLPQAGVRATAFSTGPAPEVTAGGLSTPGLTIRRRLDGGYTVALRGRGRLEVTPQGLRYAHRFWPTFAARRRELTVGIGASFLRGPEAARRWGNDDASPFEETRVLDPAPDPRLVAEAMARLRETYPALAGVEVARAWGGWIDSTPDAVPVISPVEALPGFFVAAGFSGHGFGIGPAAGRLAADLIAGDAPIVDPHPFRHSRMIDGSDLGAPGMM